MEPKNLLVLMSDEHNPRMLGSAGHPLVQTPNLDALAAAGTTFTSAYCNSPICVPSRASFATGRYVHEIGAWDNAAPYTGSAASSWGHRLGEQGRAVTTIGKLHYRNTTDDIGFPDQRIPMHVMHGVGDVFGCIRSDIPVTRYQLGHVDHAGDTDSEYVRYDTAIAAEAVRWLRAEAPAHDKPWCLFVSFTLPHFPFAAPERHQRRYRLDDIDMPIAWTPAQWPLHPPVADFRSARVQTATDARSEDAIRRARLVYYAMCSFVDALIGNVLGALGDAGLADDTRIVYTSDHGETLGDYGLWGKSVMYDSAAGVPLILAGPDVPAERTADCPVSLVDLAPTIMTGTGVEPSAADADLPGTDLWSVASGDEPADRTVFSEYHATGSASATYMLRDRRWKYIHFVGHGPQLFDMQTDPHELTNLAALPAHRQRVADFQRRLADICDPDATDAIARAAQQRCIQANGGEAAVLAAGQQINFTRAPEQFRLA